MEALIAMFFVVVNGTPDFSLMAFYDFGNIFRFSLKQG